MKNKKLVIGIIALLAVVGLLLGFWFGTRAKTAEGQKNFSVTVVHADGSSKDFSYTTDEEYLGAVLEEEGLISGFDGEFGLYIEQVDGEKAIYEENGAYWQVYIGEEYALTGLDQIPVEDGKAYKLVYEVYEG